MHEVEFEDLEEEGFTASPFPKDLMFDQWVTIKEGSLRALSEEISDELLCVMAPPSRKPRSDLVAGINAIVLTLVANLLILHRDNPEGYRLAVQMERRKKTRYDRKGFRKLPEVVSEMAELGYVIKHEAVFKQRRTTIEATGKLRDAFVSVDVNQAPLGRCEGEELIQLTARPKQQRIAGRKLPKTLVDYRDTEETIRLRKEMEDINRFLSSHSIILEGAPIADIKLVRRFTLRAPDEPHTFKFHGRLYGGFWMTLRASERHRIRINGEPIADLDFASMFPRLAYLAVGEIPPVGDLYAVPGLENHRDGAKAGLSALLSYPRKMKSLPPRLKRMLPEGWTAKSLRSAYSNFHPPLVPLLEKDFGLSLMFKESQILLKSMVLLMAEQIPTLPIHDGIMVPKSAAPYTLEAMETASFSIVGYKLPVTINFSP